MEITDVETKVLRRELDERFANAQKWIDSREYCLVRVKTTEGIVGWGECWGPAAGNREIINKYITPRLVGRHVDDVEQVHDDLVFELRSSYHSFVPASAVSGVDIALWDAYGKSAGTSVSRLLGGRRRDEVRAYATGHFFRDVDELSELEEIVADEAREHVDAGFTALKQKIGLARHFPWGPEADLRLVAAVREAVGDDVTLMVDANHAYDLADAERVARGLEAFDVWFFEEPVRPAVEYYADLTSAVDVAVAGGECWAFQHEFDRAMRDGGVAYVQPDVTSAGGITTTRRVATLADSANVQCVPHVFGSAIALAASLQVIATIPGTPILEFDRTPNPIREELAVDPITNDGDSVPIRDQPGLGIDIDEDVLDQFST
jgi:D-galactarolactone cycloisomerase